MKPAGMAMLSSNALNEYRGLWVTSIPPLAVVSSSGSPMVEADWHSTLVIVS